ncbi:MAG: hypothetical protein K2X99_05585 [Gemmatimonadaceae bacterium]|nr:hypothetical protein [Gemmatimonadaceae bacterium]
MRHSLALVGLPGAGKSTVGALVAQRLRVHFIDLDVALEAKHHQRVRDLFAGRGEAWFRDEELALTRTLLAQHPAVWAPGGGWITSAAVRDAIAGRVTTVYLQVSPEESIRRLASDLDARPLLSGQDPTATLNNLLAAREAFYLQSNHIVSTGLMTPDAVADTIVALAER